MIKSLTSKTSLKHSFWFWFFSALSLYTIYDIIKHLMYPDSIFLQHWVQWTLFSVISLISIMAVITLVHLFLQKWTLSSHWLFGGIPIFVAISVHIQFTGPLWNTLFWPHNQLLFHYNLIPILIVIGMFYAVRIIFNLISRKFIQA